MRKKKTLVMYRVCITKRPREIWHHLTDFWIKKWHPQVVLMFSNSTAFFQKRRCDCIVTYRCKNMLPLFGRNSTSFDIYIRFYLSTSPSQTRVRKSIFFATAIFTEIFTCSSWKRCTFIYLFWLCCWNNCSYLLTGSEWKGGL